MLNKVRGAIFFLLNEILSVFGSLLFFIFIKCLFESYDFGSAIIVGFSLILVVILIQNLVMKIIDWIKWN